MLEDWAQKLASADVTLRVNGVPISGLRIQFYGADRLVLQAKTGTEFSPVLKDVLAAAAQGPVLVQADMPDCKDVALVAEQKPKRKRTASGTGTARRAKSKIQIPKSKVEI